MMTSYWEIRTKDGCITIKRPGPEILKTIKEGLKKGEVTVNGKRVKIIQINGQDAWVYDE